MEICSITLLICCQKMLRREATNTSLNFELYKDIQTRGKDAFDILVKCLRSTQPHLAELLSPNERLLKEVTIFHCCDNTLS